MVLSTLVPHEVGIVKKADSFGERENQRATEKKRVWTLVIFSKKRHREGSSIILVVPRHIHGCHPTTNALINGVISLYSHAFNNFICSNHIYIQPDSPT